MYIRNYHLITVMILCLMVTQLLAQPDLPQLSPSATAYQKVGFTDVTIKYFRPGVKGRQIWGDLVPFGKVWRTGANNATTIEFSTDVKLDGNDVKAGRYALFTIPGEDTWTLILNSNADQWGAYNYNDSLDVLTVSLKPEKSQFRERLLFSFDFVTKNSSMVEITWEKLKVSFKIDAYLTDIDAKDLRLSPLSRVKQRVGLTDVTVTFGAPGVKDRTIWGDLVPYGKVWRSGANEATTVEFSTGVKLNGNDVAAGKYSFFTIPTKGEWTVILNKTAEQWGAFRYDETEDLLRFKVTPKTLEQSVERLKYCFTDLTGNSATLALVWEKLMIPIGVEVSTHEQALKNIEEAIKEKPDDWARYARSTNYAIQNDIYLDKALGWINKSLELEQNYWNNYLKAYVLIKNGDKDGAKEFLDKSWELAKKDENTLRNATPMLKQLEEKLQ